MHTNSCESFWAPIFILLQFEYAKIMTNKSYQRIARPKTTYTHSLSRNLYTKEILHTYQPHTYIHTHSLELVEKFLLNGIQAYFGALYFILSCVASWLNLLYQASKWLGETSAMPQPLVKRILFKNKFSWWKRKKKE